MDESTAVVEIQSQLFIPDVDQALDAWNRYQALVKNLLTKDDYATISGKKHRKRSGWAKLRRAFNITTTLVVGEWEDLGDGEFGYYATARAAFPDGRHEDGDGYCDTGEMKAQRGLKPTRHNVRAKAITRAKNRATADLIGSGEVSAEEVIDGDYRETRRSQRPPQSQSQPANGVEKAQRPLDAFQVRDFLHKRVADKTDGSDETVPVLMATEAQVPFLARKFAECFAGDDDATDKYHACLSWLWPGIESAKQTSIHQASVTLSWLLALDKDDTGDTPLHQHAPEEARRVLRQALTDAGQGDLFKIADEDIPASLDDVDEIPL